MPQRGMGIVRVDHCSAGPCKTLEDFSLRMRHRFDTTQHADMRMPRVVHQGYVGTRQTRETADLARMIHAHLDHSATMRGIQLKQHQWHANLIIEVASRRQHRAGRDDVEVVRLALARRARGVAA